VDRGPRRRDRLEDKLDHLVNVLMSQQVANAGGSGSGGAAVFGSSTSRPIPGPGTSTTTTSSSFAGSTPGSLNESPAASNQTPLAAKEKDVVVDATTGFPFFTPCGPVSDMATKSGSLQKDWSEFGPLFNIPLATAQQQLDTFCRDFLPFFPFFSYAGSLSALELRQRRPFLWLVIMSLATKSIPLQVKMGKAIRKVATDLLATDQSTDIDMLLGLLCFVAWSHYHKQEKFLSLSWSNLAVSMAYHLDIHRPAKHTSPMFGAPPSSAEGQRTLEERRAFVATFVLSSM
jgi:hypothetical protein